MRKDTTSINKMHADFIAESAGNNGKHFNRMALRFNRGIRYNDSLTQYPAYMLDSFGAHRARLVEYTKMKGGSKYLYSGTTPYDDLIECEAYFTEYCSRGYLTDYTIPTSAPLCTFDENHCFEAMLLPESVLDMWSDINNLRDMECQFETDMMEADSSCLYLEGFTRDGKLLYNADEVYDFLRKFSIIDKRLNSYVAKVILDIFDGRSEMMLSV